MAQKGRKAMGDWYWAPALGAVFAVVLIISLNEIYINAYGNKILPGISVNSLLLGGLDQSEAEARLQKTLDRFKSEALVYKGLSKTVNLGPGGSPEADPDLAYEFLNFDSEATVKEALSVGRGGGYFYKIASRWKTLNKGYRAAIFVNVDKERLIKALKANFSQEEKAPQNAKIEFNKGRFLITKEGEGGFFWDYERAYKDTAVKAASLDETPVELKKQFTAPSVKESDIAPFADKLNKLASIPEITILYGDKRWKVPIEVWGNWLDANNEKKLVFSLDKSREYLETLFKEVGAEPQIARFVMNKGRVEEFSPSQDGLQADLEKTLAKMNETVIDSLSNSVQLEVIKLPAPKVDNEEVKNLGIIELLGTGYSDFKGSPPNRVHNIKTGAASLNGILIKPDEEFSLLRALGEVGAKTGYKSELVIKGDKTTPEFGGGLCQIGTTIFRATMASGLPITQRQNHSFSVPYYLENGLPGTDATIYSPSPDYRFINDTGRHILIQTKIEDTRLAFEFWGTVDGRKSERAKPKVWNIVNPSETKYIETDDLKPGQKKCTEKPHKGIDASFLYTIIYPDGNKKEQTFRSHYRPWQEVCLIGKTKALEPQGEEKEKAAP